MTLTPSGIRTVFVLEARQRLRSRWFTIMLVVWFVVLAGLTLLIQLSVTSGDVLGGNGRQAGGALMFGIVTYLVLGLGSLISPALSATSINGDRSAGVLAAIQSTLLSPAEIVVGKLLAAWSSALAFLTLALPFLIWAYLVGGTRLGRMLVVIVLTALTLLVVCAIGLGCSALLGRTAASTATTYLLVIGLGLGLPLLFALSLVTVTAHEQVSVINQRDPYKNPATIDRATDCVRTTELQTVTHTERTWWLLAPSPFVVLADAAPVKQSLRDSDPLAQVRDGVRSARLSPEDVQDYCGPGDDTYDETDRQRELDRLPVVWPFGLAADLLLGGLFAGVAVRRLRVPAAKLPRGTRVA